MKQKHYFLLTLALLLFGVGAKAQVSQGVYYKPGDRLNMSSVTAGQEVFIYSMYISGETNNSGFIVNNGQSNAKLILQSNPSAFVTNDMNHMWVVKSVADVTNSSNGVSARQITLCRKNGLESTPYYLGIGGATKNNPITNAQKLNVTSWSSDPYNSSSTKVATDYCDDNGEATDVTTNLYLVSALSNGNCFTSASGSYGSSSAGSPIAFYSVVSAEKPSTVVNEVVISDMPADNRWAANTKWYRIKSTGSGCYWSVSPERTDGDYIILNNSTQPTDAAGLWCVVGNVTDGYKFYNMAKGTAYVLGTSGNGDGAVTKMVKASAPENKVTTFDICYPTSTQAANEWRIKDHLSANNYFNKRTNSVLAHWDSESAVAGDDGSKMFIEAVDDDVAANYASSYKTTILGRLEIWKNVPAVWEGASMVYETLNSHTATAINDVLEAVETACDAFVAAVDGSNVTFTTKASDARSGKALSIGTTNAGYCYGISPNHELNELIQLKANSDLTFKLYNETTGKYAGVPNGSAKVADETSATTAVTDAGLAGNYSLQISGSTTSAEENVVALFTKSSNMLHMCKHSSFKLANYVDFNDAASRWTVSLVTDNTPYALRTAITEATAWKDALNTLCTNNSGKLVETNSYVASMTSAIATAQQALDVAEGTAETREAATAALQTTLGQAQQNMLSGFNLGQRYRLKHNSSSCYMQANCVKVGGEGNVIINTLDENNVDQLFTLIPATGDNEGKYVIQIAGKKLVEFGQWNTDMDQTGSPFLFEPIDLLAGTFKVKTSKGYFSSNNAANSAGDKVYTNQATGHTNLVWTLEFVAPDAADNTTDKNELQAEMNRVKPWHDNNYANLINQNTTTLLAYGDALAYAQVLLDDDQTLAVEYTTAKERLGDTYTSALTNLLIEAGASQLYTLKSSNNLLLTANASASSQSPLTVAEATVNPYAQLFSIISSGTSGSFYIAEKGGKRIAVTTDVDNPSFAADGTVLTFTQTAEDNGLCVVVTTENGKLGTSAEAPAAGDEVTTNQTEDRVWIVTPVSSSSVANIEALQTAINNIDTYIGTGLGQYAYNGTDKTAAEISAEARAVLNDAAATVDQITEATSSATAVFDNVTINLPKVGKLYRFKGKYSGNYMTAETATPSADTKMSMQPDMDKRSTIFMLCEGSDVDGDGQNDFKLLSYNTGYYTKNTHNNGATSTNANSVCIYAAEGGTLGCYTLRTDNSGSKYVYDNSSAVDRNGQYVSTRCDWAIEEVSWLPVPVTNQYNKLGTFYSPVTLKGVSQYYAQDARLKVYTGIIDETNNALKLTAVTGDIPAGTGYVIQYQDGAEASYKDGCVYLEIADTEPDALSSALLGQYETVTRPTVTGCDIYTLQLPSAEATELEFCRYTGSTVQGFKAYLPVPTSQSIQGLIFEDGTTTVIDNAMADKVTEGVYDLSGRRVMNPTKGLYIINGQKVYVK